MGEPREATKDRCNRHVRDHSLPGTALDCFEAGVACGRHPAVLFSDQLQTEARDIGGVGGGVGEL